MTALSEALGLVMRDLTTARAVLPEVRDVQWSDFPGRDTAMLHGRDGSGQGVWVMSGDSRADQLASVADQVQEWAVEELCARGLPATWPECPEHPNAHPLSRRVRNGRGVRRDGPDLRARGGTGRALGAVLYANRCPIRWGRLA